ncbi:OadG family protein [Thiocapsa marina]|uniref:Probable oxaloacetate decarboxylase gamma chain n=1 Tax=Thiocapsa marina 5811 TaxID=768671 RepID=F9UFT4_9GAMM|nr:OadG family protein [Thiocapsa marina]EGV16958.1 oxaloacetate decarboxylase gamma chain [Thiocapsa marina 5811]
MDTAVADLLIEGLWLMAIGLGIVFTFLVTLVGLLMLMSKAVARWGPEDAPPATGVAAHSIAPSPAADGDRLVAVVGAAIQAYRRRHRP